MGLFDFRHRVKNVRDRWNSMSSSSSSSFSSHSEIDMADFGKTSTSNRPENQPGPGASVARPDKPVLSRIDVTIEDDSNLSGYNKVLPLHQDSNLSESIDDIEPPMESINSLDQQNNDVRTDYGGSNKLPNTEPSTGNEGTVNNNSTNSNSSSNKISLPLSKPYVRYIPVLPYSQPLESTQGEGSSRAPARRRMSVGPFGGPRGSEWNDGVYRGVKSIKLATGWIIDAIIIEYVDENGQIVETRHGGRGGSTYRVELDYPNEYILSIWGYYGRIIEENEIYMRSLTFQTNIRTYGPFGVEEGKYFTFPTGGKLVGFHGRGDSYLNAIGAYMELSSNY